MTNLTDLRTYFVDLVDLALGADVLVTTTGDLTTVGDAKQAKARVKVMPRESPSLDTTQNLKQLAGLVAIDVFSPRINGAAGAEEFGTAILSAITVGPSIETFGQVHVWNVWVEALQEEPAYLRLPVYIRWSVLYN